MIISDYVLQESFFCWLLGHIQQCSGLASDSVLRFTSGSALGTIWDVRDQFWVSVQVKCPTIVMYLQPSVYCKNHFYSTFRNKLVTIWVSSNVDKFLCIVLVCFLSLHPISTQKLSNQNI